MTARRMGTGLFALLLSACAAEPAAVSVRIEGADVVLESDRALRALRLELRAEPGTTITGVAAGVDAERLNLVRAVLAGDGGEARVVLTDTRRIELPRRGFILRLEAEGEGAVRIVAAEAADDGEPPVSLPVEVRP